MKLKESITGRESANVIGVMPFPAFVLPVMDFLRLEVMI